MPNNFLATALAALQHRQTRLSRVPKKPVLCIIPRKVGWQPTLNENSDHTVQKNTFFCHLFFLAFYICSLFFKSACGLRRGFSFLRLLNKQSRNFITNHHHRWPRHTCSSFGLRAAPFPSWKNHFCIRDWIDRCLLVQDTDQPVGTFLVRSNA